MGGTICDGLPDCHKVKADDEVLAMLPWMVRDWLSSRARAVLGHEGRSVYRELLDHAWLSPGCALPDNDAVLAALADLTLERWKELRPTFIALECFIVTTEGLINSKLRAAWLKSRKLRAEKRRAGKKGGEASVRARVRVVKQCLDSASSKTQAALNPPSPSPSPSPSQPNVNGLPSKAWTADAIDDHREIRGEPKAGRLVAALKAVVDRHGWSVVRPVWREWLGSDAGKYGPENFAANFLALLAPRSHSPPVSSAARARQESAEALIRGGLRGDHGSGVGAGDGSVSGLLHERGSDTGDGDGTRKLLPGGSGVSD